MIIRLILLIVVLFSTYWFFKQYQKLSEEERKTFLMRYTLYAIAGVLFILVLTGRVSWIFAAIGAVFAALSRFQMAYKLWKMISPDKPAQAAASKQSGAMTLEEACKILGIAADADRDTIIAAHRKQIQKNHPDHGGSQYLAQQINQARDILLDNL